jgi:hypothetical protein
LNTAFCFHEPGTSDEPITTRVAKGFHGLHNYANVYWFEHLLLCSRDLAALDEHNFMDAALQTLSTRFWKDQPGVATQSLELADTITAEISEELSPLHESGHIQRMVMDLRSFHARLVRDWDHHIPAEGM